MAHICISVKGLGDERCSRSASARSPIPPMSESPNCGGWSPAQRRCLPSPASGEASSFRSPRRRRCARRSAVPSRFRARWRLGSSSRARSSSTGASTLRGRCTSGSSEAAASFSGRRSLGIRLRHHLPALRPALSRCRGDRRSDRVLGGWRARTGGVVLRDRTQADDCRALERTTP